MKKTVEVKKELVNNYYNNASKHVFQDVVNGKNQNNFYKVGLLNKKDSEEQYGYSINIDGDDVSIFLKKISESHKADHSDYWFPSYYKRKAITQFKDLIRAIKIIEINIQTVLDAEEIKYGYKRINFKFSEKFNKKLSLVDEV